MKKTMRFLSIVALAFVGAVMTGCSNDDDSAIDKSQQIENTSKKVVTMTTSVGLDAGATTRALAAGGVKTFAEGEQMAVVYNNGTSTVTAVSYALKATDITDEGKTASFTFELETPNTSVDVTYIYPASMANADGSVNYAALANQNGTLASLSSDLDLATKTAAWDGTALPSCTLENQLAILALTLTDNVTPAANEITSDVTGVTVKAGADTYTVTRSASADPIYVAIKPIASEDVVISTTGGSKNYVKLLTGKTYEMGNGYGVTWKMTPIIPFGDATANDVGRVIAADGNVYDNATIATAVSTTAVAIISYVGNAGDAEVGTSYRGLAYAMREPTTRYVWEDAKTVAASNDGAPVPSLTSGWFLPSASQLTKICQGLATKIKGEPVTAVPSATDETNEYKAGYLNTLITPAGGAGLSEKAYWTSSEIDSSNAWAFGFKSGVLVQRSKANDYNVRSAIAF